jgi:hypothetical protein
MGGGNLFLVETINMNLDSKAAFCLTSPPSESFSNLLLKFGDFWEWTLYRIPHTAEAA